MSEQADSPQFEQAPATPDTSSPATPDTGGQSAPDPILARLDELSATVASLREPTAPQPTGSLDDLLGGYDNFAEDFNQFQGDPQFDGQGEQGFDPQAEAQAQQQAIQQLQSFIGDQVRNAVDPFITHQKAMQLEQKYPDLQKPEVAGHVVKQAAQYAQRIGFDRGLSPQQVADLSRHPDLIELVHLAERARQNAEQETPVSGEQRVHLEGSAGAQPGVTEDDYANRVVNAGSRNTGFQWF